MELWQLTILYGTVWYCNNGNMEVHSRKVQLFQSKAKMKLKSSSIILQATVRYGTENIF